MNVRCLVSLFNVYERLVRYMPEMLESAMRGLRFETSRKHRKKADLLLVLLQTNERGCLKTSQCLQTALPEIIIVLG